MPIAESLCCLALNQLSLQPVLVIMRGAGAHMSDQSRGLLDALERSNRKAWKSLEVVLAGESLWGRLTSRTDVKTLRSQIRAFLDQVSLPELHGRKEDFRRRCLGEYREALRAGVLLGNLVAGELVEKTSPFAAHSDPDSLLRAEKTALTRLGKDVQTAGYKTLGWLLAQPAHGEQSVIVVAARYFFRREVETNPELFRGLQFAAVDSLGDAQKEGFRGLEAGLAASADRLEQALSEVAAEILDAVADVRAGVAAAHQSVEDLKSQVAAMLAKLDMANTPVRPEHSMAVRTDREREAVRGLLTNLRALPDGIRPSLAADAGKLQVAVGDFSGAAASFASAAAHASSDGDRAEANYNSYRAKLEQKDYAGAVADLGRAVRLDPARFAPFPTDKYELVNILGAGGFGVTFHCTHAITGGAVAVKSLTASNLDQEVGAVLREATALEKLKHPAIIGLRDCGYADPVGKRRPYLVMEYFDGQTLQEYVEAGGPVPLADAKSLARALAEALAAAHANGVLHRDVKPANVMVKRTPSGWDVRLIDFGLAMRPSVLSGSMSTARGHTVLGASIAGTLDYAAPEQLGKLPGVKVSPASDVYGFGRTLSFALFATAEPTMRHYKSVPDAAADLISRCIARDPAERPQGFPELLAELAPPVAAAPPPRPVVARPVAAVAAPFELDDAPARTEPWRRQRVIDDDDTPRRASGSVNRVQHAVFAIFLGLFGVHKFLQGNSTNGAIRLAMWVVCLGPLVWLVGIFEGIQYLTMSDGQYDRTYLRGKKNWF